MSLRVIDVVPRDVWVTIEIPLGEITKVLTALDAAKITFDSSKDDPEIIEAINYLKDDFYKKLADIEEGMKRGT